MLEIVPSNQFKKDLKLAKKRGCKIEHLREVINTLAREHTLIYFNLYYLYTYIRMKEGDLT